MIPRRAASRRPPTPSGFDFYSTVAMISQRAGIDPRVHRRRFHGDAGLQ